MMATMIRRKSAYGHFRCTPKMRETIERYAKENKRTFSDEVTFTLATVYEIEEEDQELTLPPLLGRLRMPTSDRPGRKGR